MQQPHELARRMIEEVYGEGKTDLIQDLVTNDHVCHDPISGKLSRSGIESQARLYRSAFPDLTVQVIDHVSDGEKGTVRWRATGTHRGDLFGQRPSQRRVTFEGMTTVHCVGNKIHEMWMQWDALGMMQQIGAVPQLGIARPDGGRPAVRR